MALIVEGTIYRPKPGTTKESEEVQGARVNFPDEPTGKAWFARKDDLPDGYWKTLLLSDMP